MKILRGGIVIIPRNRNNLFLSPEKESVSTIKMQLDTNTLFKQSKKYPKLPETCGNLTEKKCLLLFQEEKTLITLNFQNLEDIEFNSVLFKKENGKKLNASIAKAQKDLNLTTLFPFLMAGKMNGATLKLSVVIAIFLKLIMLIVLVISLV